ncbi:FliG C-terminal domain-containing protein [Oceanospirillum multiglobuliferum]|uniref:Uncharacterized protein n=1 Tax=Oceanospirillum multiglobuliferum TaxID=64969 RepID=A0A1T4QN36_9GAMM|nr:FliG C-terminal domain-containing protein [Oceanospirillum multiglobuliferum]OPX56454.1 hypothetical protein BTE48_03230 [Oceanospirillum multiglobuliferum]SKA05159.1 FliG C-terminal domain-containing protein [Oceanospirillum multiglobuliferum]
MSFTVAANGEYHYRIEKDFFAVNIDLVDAMMLLSKLDEQLGLNPPLSQGEPNFLMIYRKLITVLVHMDSRSLQALMHAASRDLLVDLMRVVKGTKSEHKLMAAITKRNKQAIQGDVLYNQVIRPPEALKALSDFFLLVEKQIDSGVITLVDPNGEYY